MPYKCKICGANDVENQGDICEICAISQDPYAIGNSVPIVNTPVQNSPQPQSSGYIPKRSSGRKVLIHGGADIQNQDPYGNDMTVQDTGTSVQVFTPSQVPSTPAKKPPVKAKNIPIAVGITKNIKVDTQKRSFFSKWFSALFTGAPYTFGDEMTMFQVFPDYPDC